MVRRVLVAALLAVNVSCGLIAGLSDHHLDPGEDAAPDVSSGDVTTSDADAAAFSHLVTLAQGQSNPRGISADSTHVYWANESGGSVASIAKNGSESTPTLLSTIAQHPKATQVSPSQIFWGGDTSFAAMHDCENVDVPQVGIVVLDKAPDASARQLYCLPFVAQYVGSITIDGTDVYWTDSQYNDGIVVRTRQGSGASAPGLEGQHSESVALNATTVFWSRDVGISQLPKSDFPPDAAPAPFVTASSAALGLAADDDNVYYTTSSSVMKVAVSGANPTVLADSQNGPSALAIYGDDVYWTNAGSGTVMTISKNGAPAPKTLASGQGGPSSIVVDAQGVFWTNASGEVMGLLP